MKFNPRLTAPSSSNKYYNSNMNPFVPAGYGMFQNNGNCTAYAYGRFMEEANMSSCKLSTANAEKWYSKNDGYKRGQTPKLGAVACWEGLGSAAGHVAIVEQINSDGTITLSNSGWQYKLFYLTKIRPPYNIGSGYRFQGFIYNPTEFDNDPQPTPTGDKYQSYDNVQKEWLPKVTIGSNDYAGNFGHSLGGLRLPNHKYRMHEKGGGWFEWVTKADNTPQGYAGLYGHKMDGLQIENATYRVHTIEDGWLPWVSKVDNTPDGYAGIWGHTIDGIQIK